MFLHEFVYEMKRLLRQKDEIFWVLLFPMILGTMFHFAFGNLTNASENFHTIPVAVCVEDGEAGKAFADVLEEIGAQGEVPLLNIDYADRESAEDMLKHNEVSGIFYAGDDISLACLSADSDAADSVLLMEQSILEIILREYRTNVSAITELAAGNLESLNEILSLAQSDESYGKELKMTDGNMNGVVQYFYNLIAMACLYTSFAGSQIAVKNQANLSALGARKRVSPNGKFLSITAQFCSSLLTQFFCVAVNVLYLLYVLRVDFGTSLPLLLLTVFTGCVMGISFGFLIGSAGRAGEGLKMGIMICFSMLCCFLSGLMLSEMRLLVESFCPFLNDINPAVRLSDAFLTLNIYGVTARYAGNLLALLAMAAVFLCAGCFLVRRKTYASI